MCLDKMCCAFYTQPHSIEPLTLRSDDLFSCETQNTSDHPLGHLWPSLDKGHATNGKILCH